MSGTSRTAACLNWSLLSLPSLAIPQEGCLGFCIIGAFFVIFFGSFQRCVENGWEAKDRLRVGSSQGFFTKTNLSRKKNNHGLVVSFRQTRRRILQEMSAKHTSFGPFLPMVLFPGPWVRFNGSFSSWKRGSLGMNLGPNLGIKREIICYRVRKDYTTHRNSVSLHAAEANAPG